MRKGITTALTAFAFCVTAPVAAYNAHFVNVSANKTWQSVSTQTWGQVWDKVVPLRDLSTGTPLLLFFDRETGGTLGSDGFYTYTLGQGKLYSYSSSGVLSFKGL